MAAILFADVVNYSKLPTRQQQTVAQGLNEECSKHLLVAFRHQRIKTNQVFVVAMPTGDGVVVCLNRFADGIDPGLFLLRLGFELQKWGRLIGNEIHQPGGVRLRIGLHHGDLAAIEDVNFQRNFCGHDINMAQRIMDCGSENHILCSEDAFDNYFSRLPPEFSPVKFDRLESDYKIKHGANIKLYNITLRDESEQCIFGNDTATMVRWKFHILPHIIKCRQIEIFRDCSHLKVVGLTNDQIAGALREALSSSRPILPKLQRLDVYYANEDLYRFAPPSEEKFINGNVIGGNKSRDVETLKNERENSLAEIKNLKGANGINIEKHLLEYSVFPMAGILAGDVSEDHGVIQVTHYIWGRMAGTCPSLVLRRQELEEAYDIYLGCLGFLEGVSKEI